MFVRLRRSKGALSFCVASVALRGIRPVSCGMWKHDRPDAKMAMSMGGAAKTCLLKGFKRSSQEVLMSFFVEVRGIRPVL